MTAHEQQRPAHDEDQLPTVGSSVAGRRRGLLAATAAIGLGVIVVLVVAIATATSSETIEVVVPAGTAARMDAGELVELLPAVLRVDVGDELLIRNDDDEVHLVGPYTVAPGQVLHQQFTTPGRIEGVCTLHPDGEISIVVS